MKKRIFYSILMTLLLVTGCYKDEFGQIQKEIKNLQDSQIAPLEQQLKAIQKSHSELNILSDELREYVALLEEASKELEGNIGKINEKIQELKQSLNDKNVKEKGEVLARLENAKTYLEGQLSTMKSTVDVLKEKYDGIQSQMDAMDALLADKYASKDWVSGTFATIEQQNALIAEVEAVKVLANELNATVLKIESDVKTYMAELRESTLGTVDSSISAQVGELATAYESAIGTVVANVTAAFNAEIESAINTSESGIMSWVDEALKDYLTTAEAEAKLAFYKGCIGAVPDGESLQSQIDDLGALIDGIKPEIEAAYKEAIKKAIEESEGKLTKELTGEIESIKLNELKLLTDGVSALGDDVTKLWEDLGKLEKRINDLESQVDAINTTLAVILGETAPTLEEYISALDDELRGNDDARTAYLKNLVDALRYAVDGKDNDKSLQRCIEDIKTLLGTLPAGETSIVEWVQSSKTAIDLQLKSYATIAYVDGLRHEIDSATTDHSNRLDIISGRLGSAIEDSKTTICSWISEALADYMRGADFDAKLQTLVEKYEDLFSKGDQGLQNQINTLSISVRTAVAELQEAYKTKIDTCITEYNSYVVKTVDAKYEEVKGKLDADSTKFDALEATIDGMKKDVQTLNVSIDSLRDIVDSLQKFVLDKDYPSLKGIVRDFDAKLKGLTGIYADLNAFNAANEAVNKVGGYKESIEKLADFKKRLEEAEAAIANYKNLAKDFDLDGKTLKEQFDALNKELGDLKTAVFGSSSLRSQLEAIVAKDTELATAIDGLNSTLLSRLKSYTSIAFRPEGQNSDGYASFLFNGKDFTSTIMFDVRPKELSEAIAKVAKVKYVNSPTRSLANMYDAIADISSPEKGVLKADVTLPGTARETIFTGVSLALFAQGTGFDFVSDFIPVSGDRMFPDKKVINVGGTGATDLSVKVYYPKESGAINKPDNGTWFKIEKVNAQPKDADFGLSYTEYKISVDPSKSTSERSSVLTFSVGRGSNTLSCTVEIKQAPREKQDFLDFKPEEGKVKFSWKGELIDTSTNNPYSPARTAQDIVVTTSDALSDWTVKTEDTQWAKVTKTDNKAKLEVGAGTGNANYNQTGADRTGKIVFINATETDSTYYSFTQFPRPQQRLVFNPDTTVGLSFGHGKTEKSNGQKTFTVKSSDGEYDWDCPEPTGTNSWIHRSVATSGTPRTVTVWTDANPDTTARTGYISFTTKTGMNDTTYLYPIHQDAAPKQTFIFSPREYLGQNCYIGEDGLIHIGYRGGSDMYIYVKGDPIDDWTMTVNDAGSDDWLSGSGRSEALFAPSGFKYYIQITAKENEGETDRDASIRITCDGKDYDYKVIQDHKTADINNFDPASGKIEFYWDGRVIGDDGIPTSATYKDIEVTTGNGSYGWTVAETPDIPWAKVEKRTGLFSANVRISDVEEYKNTEEDRTGTLTFTSETQKTYSYTFTQLKAAQTTATVTIGGNEVEKLIISGNGKQYKLSDSDTQWKDIRTYNVSNVQTFLATVTIADDSEWSAALDPKKTSEGWGIAAARVRYSNRDYLGLSAYGSNETGSSRSAEIVISNDLGEICRIPVVQEVRPAQSFTFRLYNDYKNYYYIGSEDGLIHVKNGGRDGIIRVYVTGSPDNSDWTVTYPSNSWISRNGGNFNGRNGSGDNKYIQFKADNNTGVERTADLIFNIDGKSYTYKVYQDSRTPYTFIINDRSFDYKEQSTSFDIVTDPSGNDNRDWNVKVLDSDGSEVGGDFWLKAENKNKDGKVYLTLSQNGTEERKAQLLFYTFEGETAASARKITITQTARPDFYFKDLPESKSYAYDVTGDSFEVHSSDGSDDWTIRVLDENGNNNPVDWLTAEKEGISVSLTMTQNDGNADRVAKVRFYTLNSAATMTVTQEARLAQTFTSITPSIDGNEFSYSPQSKEITVTTSDGLNDYSVAVSGTGVSYTKAENKVTLSLSENTTGGEINGSITFTSHGGGDVRTMSFTQQKKPDNVTLSLGTIDEFDFVGGYSQKLTVTTTPSGITNWTVEKKKLASEDNDWLSYDKVDDGVNVSAALNTGSARSTGLLFKSPSGEEYPVTVSQEAVGTVTLTFGETTWSEIDGNSDQTKIVTVDSSHPLFTAWDVNVTKESVTDFLTAQKNPDGKSVTLKASKNGTQFTRSATVTFISDYNFVEGNTIKCSQTACLAAGTKITMADGSLKKVEDIVEGDLVRTFNHEKGQMDAARICLTYKGGSKATPLTLSFASGKKLSIVGTHDLLSQDTRKYVRINRGNVASFVGKSFYNAESGQWDKLIGYKLDTTPVDYYCIYTTNHLNCIAEGMLTVPDDVDFFLNIYALDANLKADLKQLAADIKQYGLMDPRKDYPQYPELQALGESLLCKYLYIALAKGYVTEEEFTMLLEAFVARWS